MIAVVGEALVDVLPDGHEAVGGSPLNVAVALSRLDAPACLVTQLGDDARGRRIADHVTGSGVELETHPLSRTSTATVRLDAAGVASYDFDLAWTLPGQQLPACDALHVGSLGTLLEPGRDSVLDLVEQAWQRDVFVSYDPNLRPDFITDAEAVRRDVESLAARACLVKLSEEDADVLHPGADPGDIARSLVGVGRTELVVLTRGAGGATAYVEGGPGSGAVHVPSPAVAVADTVGAGDTFMAGLLAILFEDGALGSYGPGIPGDEAGLVRLLSGAAAAAAVTCSRPGAQPPLRSELPAAWPAPRRDG